MINIIAILTIMCGVFVIGLALRKEEKYETLGAILVIGSGVPALLFAAAMITYCAFWAFVSGL